MYYGQNQEDRIVCEYFDRHPAKSNSLLDIGAADGRTFSNSRALIERGWGGVLVEGSAGQFKALLDLYQNTSPQKIVLINAVVWNNADPLVAFHQSPDLVSSVDRAHVAKWSSAVPFRETWTPCVAPTSIAKMMADRGIFPDFVSIDVEGKSYEIARDLHWVLVQAAVVCLEHDGNDEGLRAALSDTHPNVLLLNGENIILSREK